MDTFLDKISKMMT